MLNLKEIALLACVLGPTSLTAIVAAWRYPQLGWASVGILATAAGIVFFRPIFFAFHTSRGWEILVPYFVLGGILGVVHLGFFGYMVLMLIEKAIERWRAGGNEGTK